MKRLMLTAVIRDVAPVFHLQEPCSYRSVHISLTNDQLESLTLRKLRDQGTVTIEEEISQCFLEEDNRQIETPKSPRGLEALSLPQVKTKMVFAKWYVLGLTYAEILRSIEDLHIECGAGDDQYEAYFPDDIGCIVTIKKLSASADELMRWEISMTCPSNGLEDNVGYWLSPINLECQTYDENFAEKKSGDVALFGIEP